MESYKEDFIDFMVRAGVLRFGEFKTKSGRIAPYFINTGNYRTGEQIFRLGQFYAECIKEKISEDYDLLYGPAYKGIPLVVTTAASLYNVFAENKPYSFNRKEMKDHGEGGSIIGSSPQDNDKILIIEDVITAGTSVRESVSLLKKIANVEILGLIISVDRMEKGNTGRSAVEEIREEFGIKTYSIVTVNDIIEHLYNKEIDNQVIIDDKMKEKIQEYLFNYGV